MPISKVDYNTDNTVIYKIQCVDGSCDFVYFGSTTNFATRKSQHKSACDNINGKSYNSNPYKTIRENKGWENFEMCLVEVYPCENKQQLVIREQFYIDSNRHDMNTRKAYRTIEEGLEQRRKYNLEHNKEYRDRHIEEAKKYVIDNREVINKNRSIRYEKKKDILNEIRRKKRELNKEHINETKRQKYQDNKNK